MTGTSVALEKSGTYAPAEGWYWEYQRTPSVESEL